MRQRVAVIAILVVILGAGVVRGASFFDILPPAKLDPRVPAITKVTGWSWGEDVTDPEQIASYARLLAESVPEKVRLVEYARSLEGRPLELLIVSSAANIDRLDGIRGDLDRFADPRAIPAAEARRLAGTVPAVVWVACSVHGDETSGGDAGLALAYLLAAGDSAEIRDILERTVVIIDPAQNPDGRARFVAGTRQARGPDPDPEPASAEHVQPWPGGRFSHDLFDLNRDWFALTHPETAGRVAAMLRWHPCVVMDLHEMGADMGYYFAPPAAPLHPGVSKEQAALWDLVGRANAAAFDAHGWRYWTRELFDAFYPGYGESWPYFSGALGMTYEQASSRGRVMKLRDGGVLTYAEAVQHHLVTSFTATLTVSRDRERFVRSWFEYRRTALEDGEKGSARAWLLEPGADPERAAALGDLLARQGIEVYRLNAAAAGAHAGSVVIPLAQPLGRLAEALLERDTPMGAAFEKEQERRYAKRQHDEIYDITAWSLPLLWDVPARTIAALPAASTLSRITPGQATTGGVSGEGRVAFLLPWTGLSSARALAALLRRGVAVDVAGKPFAIQGRRFERGALVIRRVGNGDELRERLDVVARRFGVQCVGVDTGFADEGIDLGSSSVRRVKAPRIGLLWDAPVSPTGAGHLRYAIERFLGYPVTPVRVASLGRADLADFDVLVIPDSRGSGRDYAAQLGEETARRLSAWVSEGGVVIAVGGGAEYLGSEKVGLLSTRPERLGGPSEAGDEPAAKDGKAAGPSAPAGPFDYDRFIVPGKESPPDVPGAIALVDLDTEDILAAGFPSGHVDVLVDSGLIFSPLKLDKGVNVGVYATADRLREAGFMLKASREQLPRKAYLMVEPHGRGKVVAFAEDPAIRGFTHGTMLLLANAVFLEPAL
ncbi:MAG: M14 family zinc carboxypeptidase [Acidobacteriota bacterium]